MALSGKQKKKIIEELNNAREALSALRNTFGKGAVDKEQRLKTLQEIYDSASLTLQDSVLTQDYEGTGALSMILERVSKQIEWLDQDSKDARDNTITVKFSKD